MRIKSITKIIFSLTVVTVLSACGGSSFETKPPTDQAVGDVIQTNPTDTVITPPTTPTAEATITGIKIKQRPHLAMGSALMAGNQIQGTITLDYPTQNIDGIQLSAQVTIDPSN